VQLFSRLLLFSADIFFFRKKKIVEEFLNDYSLHEIRFFVFYLLVVCGSLSDGGHNSQHIGEAAAAAATTTLLKFKTS
jgi:hypothetical protein